jgi:hypothetical protein
VVRHLASLLWIPLLLTTGAAEATVIVEANAGCYEPGQRVEVRGNGFLPNVPYAVTRNGTELGGGTTNSQGGFIGRFTAPKLERGKYERDFTITVTDGINSGSTHLRVSALDADFSPKRGDPASTRVRFTAHGFGVGSKAYLHYFRPSDTIERTVKLGNTTGPCGALRTGLRRMFAFSPTPGKWTLKLSASRNPKARAVPFVKLTVEVGGR